jgi:hypothetical protein
MYVIVTERELPEFQTLCQDLDTAARPQSHWPVWTAPLVSTECYEFEIGDDTAMATWIAMSRNHWIGHHWRTLTRANTNPSLKGIDSCH